MSETNEKVKSLWRKILLAYLALCAYAAMFFVIAGEDINLKTTKTEKVTAVGNVGEITDDRELLQTFTAEQQKLTKVNFTIGTYNRINTGTLHLEVLDESGNVASSVDSDISELKNGENNLTLDPAVEDAEGKTYTMRITTDGSVEGNAVTIYYGEPQEGTSLVIDGAEAPEQELQYSVQGKLPDPLGPVLEYGMLAAFILAGIYVLRMPFATKEGKRTYGIRLANAVDQFRFLMGQLVARDFKVRYKRSVLGVMWSFINPLLVMVVQYFVFSKIFRSSIENYIVYLLIGITFFNFYNEATMNGLLSIVGNASLIKKVYVPKYIYPLSKVLSGSINFAIALALMFLITFISGVKPNIYMLLIPYAILCMFILNIGVSLILATGMVFFRDVQFIYNVIMTLLSYATPMFWDMSMMPTKYQEILKLNPLCAIIMFTRSIILDAQFPGTQLTLYSLVIPLILLLFGALLFKKYQDRFVLYI